MDSLHCNFRTTGPLSAIERQFLTLVGRGLTMHDIVDHLVLDPDAVDQMIEEINRKLDSSCLLQSVMIAMRFQLLPGWSDVAGHA